MNNLLTLSKIYKKEQIKSMENSLFEHIPSYSVMFYAAVCFIQQLRLDIKNLPDYHFNIIIGSGNNGGDALIIAALLHQYGYATTAYIIKDPNTDNAKKALSFAKSQKLKIKHFDLFKGDPKTIIIDGLLGIGFSQSLSTKYLEVIQIINNSSKHKTIAIDVPSGLDPDKGFSESAIIADQTVTFIGDKIGFYTANAKKYTGIINTICLGNPLIGTKAYRYLIFKKIKSFPANVHKGNFKHTLIIGGGQGMFGAACLSATAALKAGAGKVSMYTHPDYQTQYHLDQTPIYEVMRCTQLEDFSNYNSICIGPGLGRGKWGETIFLNAINTIVGLKKTVIIDADGLYHLAKHSIHQKTESIILTPHESEAATLLNCSVSDVTKDRFKAATTLAKQYHCIVVLKGFHTIICDEENLYINQSGNSQLATAGSGDILAGLISGYSYLPYTLIEKVCFAVDQHGKASEQYQKKHTQKSLKALDILDYMD